MNIQQDFRQASLHTALGKDVLVLRRFSATERLSQPFTITVDALAQDGPIDFIPQLGTPAVIQMQAAAVAGVARYFSGILFEARYTGAENDGAHYQLVLKPWFSLLAGNLNLRIFSEMSVKDIFQKLVTDAGFSAAYQWDAAGKCSKRPYCVQYRESDFSFLSRLMEEEGIYYYFEHDDSGHHIMHLCDDKGQHSPVSGLATTPYITPDGSGRSGRPPHLWRWDEHVQPGPLKVTLRDYNFIKPSERNEEKAAGESSAKAEQSELYDVPGGYAIYANEDPDIAHVGESAKPYATHRLDAARAERQLYFGQGDAFALACGHKFKLSKYPDDRLNAEYLIVGATHLMDTEQFRSGGGGGEMRLHVDVEGIPAATQWRAPLRTPKPVVAGPQTATVVGAKGEVINTDKYGRVKVLFHWDREGKGDGKNSCWVRVSQAWSESTFGTMMIPRVGSEVIIDFLEGDPDQPIIVGRVYNPNTDVPYTLPANKTRSTWKSRTVGKSGSYDEAENPPPSENGYNEVRFEDEGGKEQFYMHAQRNMDSWVRLDQTHTVGRDVAMRVGRNRATNIKKNETVTVETGDETREIQKGSRHTKINKADELTVETGDSTTTISSGNYTVNVNSGKVLITSPQEILLKVGSNTLKLSQQGLDVDVMTVNINAQMNATVKANMALSAQGGMTTEVKGGIQVTINGAMVMIN